LIAPANIASAKPNGNGNGNGHASEKTAADAKVEEAPVAGD
jgi:hypothetical protein